MKKTLTAITLAMVLTFGTTLANAGIIIGDRAGIIIGDSKEAPPCSKGDVGKDTNGIIIGDLFDTIYGIIIGDKPAPCVNVDKNGIIIGD